MLNLDEFYALSATIDSDATIDDKHVFRVMMATACAELAKRRGSLHQTRQWRAEQEKQEAELAEERAYWVRWEAEQNNLAAQYVMDRSKQIALERAKPSAGEVLASLDAIGADASARGINIGDK